MSAPRQQGISGGQFPPPLAHADGPLVTVITATWNAAATLEKCLASVEAQDYPHIEHLVVDGASRDNTVEILQRHEGTRLRWVSEPDRGIYDAWNKGLRLARGEWIAFLGADDVYLPDAISAYVKLAAEHPEAEYLSGRVRWRRPNGKTRLIGGPWRWPRFQRYMTVAHVGSMHRQSLFERYGSYDDSLKIVADYEFLLRAGRNLRTAFLPSVTAEMQSGGASDSIAATEEAARIKRVTGRRSALLVEMERLRASWGHRLRQLVYRRDAPGEAPEA